MELDRGSLGKGLSIFLDGFDGLAVQEVEEISGLPWNLKSAEKQDFSTISL